MRRNSITPSRAFFTRGVVVLMFMLGMTGIAHDATGLGGFSGGQAHAAGAGDGQALMVAEAGNVHASLLARLEHGDALRDVRLHAVDEHRHGIACSGGCWPT